MYNKSLSTCAFPNGLKFSVVKPLYKKGDRTNISNLRPISLLASFSKIFQNVIHSKLYRHTQHNNILANDQYGFRRNSSTEKASYKLIHDILSALSNKLSVAGIFCDMEKAFDCVNHDMLLSKLEFYELTGKDSGLINLI
jgi:hypothetical protein